MAKHVRAVFDRCSRKGDGYLDISEVEAAFAELLRYPLVDHCCCSASCFFIQGWSNFVSSLIRLPLPCCRCCGSAMVHCCDSRKEVDSELLNALVTEAVKNADDANRLTFSDFGMVYVHHGQEVHPAYFGLLHDA